MNRKIMPTIVVIFSVFFLTGWSLPFSDSGPKNKDYEKYLNEVIIAPTKGALIIEDLKILVNENIGTKVEPKYQARIKANLRLEESLYETKKSLLGKDIVSVSAKKGQKFKLTGIMQSTLKDDEKWDVKFIKVPSILPKLDGFSLGQRQKGSYVIAGTEGEKALIKEKRQADLARENERKEKIAKVEAGKKSLISTLEGKWISTSIQTNYRNNGKFKDITIGRRKNNKENLIYTLVFSDKDELTVDIKGSRNIVEPVSTTADARYINSTKFTFQTKDKRKLRRWSTGKTWNVELKDNKLIAVQTFSHNKSIKWVITMEKV